MLSLPPELNTQCSEIFVRCRQFGSTRSLRAVFTNDVLAPFIDGLPDSTGTKREFVSVAKLFLLETHLADGRALILPFLEALADGYPEQQDLHGELRELHRRILAHAQVGLAPEPPPGTLGRYFISYSPTDGALPAERLYDALAGA
jgi:hypothetical protein